MRRGFTLAELLIALAILGVIATFTIPKVLQGQQSSQSKAIAKEAAATISGAYSAYQLNNTVAGNFSVVNLTPYINYVKVVTSGNIDDTPTQNGFPCIAPNMCVLLHNGATIGFYGANNFGGTGTTNAQGFVVDPDGKFSNTTADQPGKGIEFALYYNGRMATWGTVAPGTQYSGGAYTQCPSCDPSWFSWD